MRLASVRIEGFKRFEAPTTMDVGPTVVALVGPNEAGKSSVLDVLRRLDETTDEPAPFSTSERSGRPDDEPDADKEVVSALYVVEQDDHDALHNIPGADQVRLYRLWRTEAGRLHHQATPRLKRPRELREAVAKDVERLRKAATKPIVAFLNSPIRPIPDEPDPDDIYPLISEVLPKVSDALIGDADTLNRNSLELLEQLAEAVRESGLDKPAYLTGLPDRFAQLLEEQRAKHPHDQLLAVLDDRTPSFQLIRDRERQLVSDYAFEDFPEGPPEPLRNLLSLTDSSFEDFRAVSQEPGDPRLADLERRANDALEAALYGSWRRGAKVSVAIRVSGGVMHVHPYDADSGRHSRIDDRSDGFRSFLALLAFTASRRQAGVAPILLIDEAELHLHVDAQADLVEVLTRQSVASKIIYTTHSPACLPEDLGSSVRVVRPIAGDRSELRDDFWHSNSPGFAPLMVAMGASISAFTPTRRAVIGEGPSDALLLPTLIRAADGLDRYSPLGFQVAGGLAWVSDEGLRELEMEARRVAYVVDSDTAGTDYRNRLRGVVDVPSERVIDLRAGSVRGLTVEDFIDPELHCDAINFLLEHMREVGDRISPSDLPPTNRVRAIDAWCKQRSVRELPRPAVASEVARLAHPSPRVMSDDVGVRAIVVDARRRNAMVRVHRSIRAALGITDDADQW